MQSVWIGIWSLIEGGGDGLKMKKWEKNGGVRVREVFKNKFAMVFRIVLGVRNGFTDPLDFRTVCKLVLGVLNGFADPLDFRIACELVLGMQNGI